MSFNKNEESTLDIVCKCGEKLGDNLYCSKCNKFYILDKGNIEELTFLRKYND